MEFDIEDEINRDDIVFYSVLYSTVTVAFAMAVLSKFLTNEFRFGFRSFLTLVILFLGEPLCQFLVKGPSGLAVFTLLCLVIYSILPASHLPAQNKSVLITGCDSGFGHALALKLDSIGMQVFAGCLEDHGPGALELKNKCSSRLQIIKLDITNQKEIDSALTYVSSQVKEGLWGLVNNAGVCYVGELEMTSEKVLQKVMDVNLFGAVRMTKAFLPLIKEAHGRVVNVSSLLGRVSLEGYGAYSMSKHALVAYTNTLRLEMKKWGVDVSVVEPMGYNTGNMREDILLKKKEDVWDSLDDQTKKVYGREYLDAVFTNVEASTEKLSTDLTPVIRCIRTGLLSKRPRERYSCETGAEIMLCLYPLLPVWIVDHLSKSISVLPRNISPVGCQENK
ncbi:retinol dehydrogenase 7-like [Physella acuta]|uniref:retinol dehydrogenase 7-like n=1 Tax=Physella acuta TaxID=109671 RepID=UPI0027DE478C|nr:retinol dehydrogenase 7-like [Physella acuta]